MTSRHSRTGALVSVLDRLVTKDYPIHAVTIPSRHAILKIDAFPDFLRSLYQPALYWGTLDAPPTTAALRAAL